MTQAACPTRPPHAWPLLAGLLMLALPAAVWGDAVKLGGFWIEVDRVSTIEDGRIVYVTPNDTEVRVALSRLEGVRLDDHPQLEKAQAHDRAGEYEKAIDLFQSVADEAEADWLNQYVRYRLLRSRTKAGQGSAAANAYLDLIEADADDHFLTTPPVAGLNKLSDAAKTRLERRIRNALGHTNRESVTNHLTKLRSAMKVKAKAVEDESPPRTGASHGTAEPSQPSPKPSGSSSAQPNAAGVTLPKRLQVTPAVQALKQGRLNQARTQAKKATQTTRGLAENLFILGLTQLAIAERSEAPADYEDAGLSFMRVVVYFENSPYTPLALLETGYVHQKIDRPEIARQLYAQARRAMENEGAKDAYPNYYPRLLKLIGNQ